MCCVGDMSAPSFDHVIKSMKEGGDGSAKHEGWQLIVGWVYGLLQIAFFVGVALFAIRDRGGSKSLLLLTGLERERLLMLFQVC